MSNDFWLVIGLCVFTFGPATLILLLAEFTEVMKPKKKQRGKVIVVPDEPDTRVQCPKCNIKSRRTLDTRVQCPKCNIKSRRTLEKTERITISGKPRRRGYYKCECGQWFARLLQD
jgi:hypothetical protein